MPLDFTHSEYVRIAQADQLHMLRELIRSNPRPRDPQTEYLIRAYYRGAFPRGQDHSCPHGGQSIGEQLRATEDRCCDQLIRRSTYAALSRQLLALCNEHTPRRFLDLAQEWKIEALR